MIFYILEEMMLRYGLTGGVALYAYDQVLLLAGRWGEAGKVVNGPHSFGACCCGVFEDPVILRGSSGIVYQEVFKPNKLSGGVRHEVYSLFGSWLSLEIRPETRECEIWQSSSRQISRDRGSVEAVSWTVADREDLFKASAVSFVHSTLDGVGIAYPCLGDINSSSTAAEDLDRVY